MENKRKSCCMSFELHDCYAEDTKVTMTAYENMDIKDVRVGDRIRGMHDKCLVVEDVIVGYEAEICHIVAENGCEIRVTKEHILKMITKESPSGKDVCAKEVQAGDVILSCDGAVRITSAQIEAYGNRVYNFIFQ
ncbi:MAG: hypothetical protein PHE06_10900, partial [Lachnospiraceae bacterium]|nr:hypothetical protein [Lachnospiraceae bacterium]